MKKLRNILTISIILSVISTQVYASTVIKSAEDMPIQNLQENFFEKPAFQQDFQPSETKGRETAYPVFKKIRIHLTNFINEKEYNHTQKLLQKEKERQAKEDAEFYSDLNDEEKTQESVTQAEENVEAANIQLEGGVKEQITQKEVQLNADKIRFKQETMDLIATGSPVLYFPPQNTTIKAKKMVYNHESNILKAYENVEIIKDGQSSFGDYFELNMNEEFGFMDNVKSKVGFLTVTSRKADIDEKKVTLYDGCMVSEQSFILRTETDMIGGYEFKDMIVPKGEESTIFNVIGDTRVNIKADEVIVDAKKNNDTITFKKAKIRYGDVDLYTIPSMTLHTNKNHEYFEGNYPEFGSRSQLGSFIGPGFVFDTPLQSGSSVKVIPIINNGDGQIGFGGLMKYRSGTNFTEFGMVSSYNRPVLRGRQELDDKLYLQYGMNSYLDNWILGYRFAKYNAELLYKDSYNIPKTFKDNLGFSYSHRAGIGYMQNADYNFGNDRFGKNDLGTMRLQYMAQAIQDLYKYEKPEDSLFVKLRLYTEGSAAVYGTGDTQFVGRIGPSIETQNKRWFQAVRYYLSAYQDGTPMPAYDAYRYGHGNLYIKEAFRLCKYLTLAWSGSFNLTNDAPNGKLLQENMFILMIGPDDLKFHIGYDIVREQFYFSCVIAMDTKGSSLSYNKFTIKNPEKLANNNLKQVELKVFDNPDGKSVKAKTQKRMMYAEVIDIEEHDEE